VGLVLAAEQRQAQGERAQEGGCRKRLRRTGTGSGPFL
jgi:hypothetical protein